MDILTDFLKNKYVEENYLLLSIFFYKLNNKQIFSYLNCR